MRQEITESAASAASSAGLRPLIGGGLMTFSGGASHWIDWINNGLSIALSLLGLAAVLYGFWRQHEQRVEERARAAREVDIHRMASEKHALELQRLQRALNPQWPEL